MAKKNKEKKAAAAARSSDQSSAKKSGVLTNPIRNLIITALVCIALGAAFIAEPTLVYTYCGFVIGGVIGLIGLIYIIIYFARRPVSGVYRSEFAIGLLALLAGAYVAFSNQIPETMGLSPITFTLAAVVRIVGILIVADGILKFQYTLDLIRMKFKGWWLGLIVSILGIVLGVLITTGFIYGLDGTMGLSGMMFLGIAFAANGVLDLIAMILVAVRNHKANKADSLAAAEALAEAAKGGQTADFSAPAPVATTTASAAAAPSVTTPAEPAPAPVEPEIPEPASASPAE